MEQLNFQPLADQILVKILPYEDRADMLWIPQTVERGRLAIRRGVVVALGSGDVVAPKCDRCEGAGCPSCEATGFLPHERTDFSVQVGDEVLYHPRGWAEFERDGEKFICLHENQHVLGVVDKETSYHPVAPEKTGNREEWAGEAAHSRQ